MTKKKASRTATLKTPKGKTITVGQYIALAERNGQPCEHEHLTCAAWDHGPCSDELASQQETENENNEVGIVPAIPDDLSIPAALDRRPTTEAEKAKVTAKIQAIVEEDRKHPANQKGNGTPPARPDNLTDADKAAIAEITTQQAEEKAEKTARRIEELKANKKRNGNHVPPTKRLKLVEIDMGVEQVRGLSEQPSPKHGSKNAMISDLLRRPEGCTTADVLKLTGWPAVSMPQQAKAAGLTLRKEKVSGQSTRYYGSANA
jgi:hypothetical protein